jgi:hypothetical protein
VEFFRDEVAARCPSCGHRFFNPGANFGCAAWCALAKECLGFTPQRPKEQQATSGGRVGALAARLIQAIKALPPQSPARLARALAIHQRAKELLASEGGEPWVVLAAALLWETAAESGAEVRHILASINVDPATSESILACIDEARSSAPPATREARLLRAAAESAPAAL